MKGRPCLSSAATAKERTGGLDEVAVRDIQLELEKFRTLEKRKAAIIESIENSGLMTAELMKKSSPAMSLRLLRIYTRLLAKTTHSRHNSLRKRGLKDWHA